MSNPNTQPGDQIRLVVLAFEREDGTEVNSSLRIPWPEGTALPVHSCNADICESCVEQGMKKAHNKVRSGSGNALAFTGAVRLLRDGQSRSF